MVVVATSDQSPLLRLRAALAATAVAEYFAARNRHVLLVVDSLTRVAMAQREIGLAAGEPPTAKGYTPSVFSLLAQLVERAGHFGAGSITAFYSLLMEGDDQQDPLVDAVRALLDGHIVLDRRLAAQNHFPPIAVLDSLSRLVTAVCDREHLMKIQRLRKLLAAYAASEDLIRVGAYQKGADAGAGQSDRGDSGAERFLAAGSRRKIHIGRCAGAAARAAGLGWMPFHFTLQAVLRLRTSYEQMEKLRLLAITRGDGTRARRNRGAGK